MRPVLAAVMLLLSLAACAAQPVRSMSEVSGPIVPDVPRIVRRARPVAPAVDERLDALDQDLQRQRGTLEPDKGAGR